MRSQVHALIHALIYARSDKRYHGRMNHAHIRRFCLGLALLLLGGCMSSHNRPLQLLNGAGPAYPPVAKSQGLEGQVTVRYSVSRAGVVGDLEVVDSQPPGVFDDAALAAVRSWRYRAPVRGGQAVAVPEVTSVVRFRLNESPDYLLDD